MTCISMYSTLSKYYSVGASLNISKSSKSQYFVSKQLILPECMKLLPLYVNCIIKNDALSGGKNGS